MAMLSSGPMWQAVVTANADALAHEVEGAALLTAVTVEAGDTEVVIRARAIDPRRRREATWGAVVALSSLWASDPVRRLDRPAGRS